MIKDIIIYTFLTICFVVGVWKVSCWLLLAAWRIGKWTCGTIVGTILRWLLSLALILLVIAWIIHRFFPAFWPF